MELEVRPGPPLMLKEWLELESSAELSRDGFGCYPRHLAAELRSGSGGRRNGDVIAKVSAAVRAALFPLLGREGEAALYRSFSRRLRVGFWKKRRGEGEEVDRRVASCSVTTASGRREGSSPAMSPRRRSCEGGQAGGVGAGVGGRQRHETEVVGCETTCRLNEEQEQQRRLSPVSVMNFLSQDEDDGEDADLNGDSEDDGDDEIASPTFQQSLANIRRASQQLQIRQFEQLDELDTSDVDDATTATEDISCHMAESDFIGEDSEGAPLQGLLDLLQTSTPGSTHCFQKLLVDFLCDGLSSCHGERSDGPDRAMSLLETAKAWLDGQSYSLRSEGKAEMTEEIERLGRRRCFREDEQELLAVDLEGGIFWSLVGELVGELR